MQSPLAQCINSNVDNGITKWLAGLFLDLSTFKGWGVYYQLRHRWRQHNTKSLSTLDETWPILFKAEPKSVVESFLNVPSQLSAACCMVLQYGKNEISTNVRFDYSSIRIVAEKVINIAQ